MERTWWDGFVQDDPHPLRVIRPAILGWAALVLLFALWPWWMDLFMGYFEWGFPHVALKLVSAYLSLLPLDTLYVAARYRDGRHPLMLLLNASATGVLWLITDISPIVWLAIAFDL